MIYALPSAERARLTHAIRAALAVPFIAGVEGYIWEAIFHYVKGFPLPDPHAVLRKKLLFDAVNAQGGIGWSLKAVQKNPKVGAMFEVVIQRADVLKKRVALGFPKLTLDASPQIIGAAVLKHWQGKIALDAHAQQVRHARIALLLKSRDHRQYALLEQDLAQYAKNELVWSWTDQTRTGLQASHKETREVVYRWYPNQKQLFEVFTLDPESFRFEVDSTRLDASAFVEMISGLSK
jgi:hypothetical protein